MNCGPQNLADSFHILRYEQPLIDARTDGLAENIERILPENCSVQIQRGSWDVPPVFDWLQSNGRVKANEMYRTFNCGVGMVLVIDQADEEDCLRQLNALGETSWVIGEVAKKENGPSSVIA